MAVFLATVGPDALDNWRLCRRDGVWGVRERGRSGRTGTANAQRVKAGDTIYVWRSKGRDRHVKSGIFAKAVALGGFQTIGGGAAIPWPDRAAYLGSFPIDVLAELAEPVPDRFEGFVGVESGIENIALIHGFREITNPDTIDWIERAFTG